ncbi:hypothetical protein KS4_23220 [Poriferisphaera corsica]|uniref:Uncharacterized protein n=1 Tax=Poriferisphaera corsica TaxID=2528020 RepID=A0A517YVM1_9BACT|nr:hypothetical protein [Poriferisphaera corsica]QDU34256.1 hypothetical protein KS4_23220 [Poriferisphaera corsica]
MDSLYKKLGGKAPYVIVPNWPCPKTENFIKELRLRGERSGKTDQLYKLMKDSMIPNSQVAIVKANGVVMIECNTPPTPHYWQRFKEYIRTYKLRIKRAWQISIGVNDDL